MLKKQVKQVVDKMANDRRKEALLILVGLMMMMMRI